MRQCSKTSCRTAAVATLTYNYADSTVVLGPMSRLAEPHTYDLCERHARTLTAPRGWEILRIEAPGGTPAVPAPEPDDLLALAHAVREPEPRDEPAATPPAVRRGTGPDAGPRPEPLTGDAPARPGRPVLRLLRDATDD
ncbi:DUF3499 domain-containing protein [Citricoccus sp. SGAir0253]|nr:DUF3499 domain-containing protein [Citricoccus sp. SGAir0253]